MQAISCCDPSAGGTDLCFVCCIARWLHLLYRNFGPRTDICRKNYRLLWHAPKNLSQCDCTMTRARLSSSGLGLLVSADYIWARFLCTSPLVSHRKLGRLHISLQIICHHNGGEKVPDVLLIFDTCSVCNKDEMPCPLQNLHKRYDFPFTKFYRSSKNGLGNYGAIQHSNVSYEVFFKGSKQLWVLT